MATYGDMNATTTKSQQGSPGFVERVPSEKIEAKLDLILEELRQLRGTKRQEQSQASDLQASAHACTSTLSRQIEATPCHDQQTGHLIKASGSVPNEIEEDQNQRDGKNRQERQTMSTTHITQRKRDASNETFPMEAQMRLVAQLEASQKRAKRLDDLVRESRKEEDLHDEPAIVEKFRVLFENIQKFVQTFWQGSHKSRYRGHSNREDARSSLRTDIAKRLNFLYFGKDAPLIFGFSDPNVENAFCKVEQELHNRGGKMRITSRHPYALSSDRDC